MKTQIKITLIVVFAALIIAAGIGYLYLRTITPENTISVNGEATIKAKPDIVSIYFNVETKGNSAQEAKDRNSEISDKIISDLIKKGLEKNEIATENYNIYEDYVWENNKQKFLGYKASQTIKVTLDSQKMNKAGEVIDVGVDDGALLNYINFELSKEKENSYKALALKQASEDAKIKAESIASGVEKKVRDIKTISALEFNYYPWRVYESTGSVDISMAKKAVTNIEAGDKEINARVNIVFVID